MISNRQSTRDNYENNTGILLLTFIIVSPNISNIKQLKEGMIRTECFSFKFRGFSHSSEFMFTEADRSYSQCKATKQRQTSALEFELSSFSLLWSVLELSSHNGITYVQLTFPNSINLLHITFDSYPKKIVSMVIPKPLL